MCIANICSIVVNFKLWFQCNHIIFLSRHFFSSVLIIMFLRVYFSQWLTGFAPLLSVLSISSSFWVKINFSCQLFAVIFSRSSFLLALNYSVVACVTSIFFIVNVSSLLRPPLDKRSTSCKVINLKMFLCDDTHCSSIFLFPLINWFLFF